MSVPGAVETRFLLTAAEFTVTDGQFAYLLLGGKKFHALLFAKHGSKKVPQRTNVAAQGGLPINLFNAEQFAEALDLVFGIPINGSPLHIFQPFPAEGQQANGEIPEFLLQI